MAAKASTQFFRDPSEDIEFVYLKACEQAYPTHSHVSVYTISIVLAGEIFLTKDDKTTSVIADDAFLILPYEAHSLHANMPYDMLSVCINKSLFKKQAVPVIFEKITEGIRHCAFDHLLDRENLNQIWHFLNDCAHHTARHNVKESQPRIESIKSNLEEYPEQVFTLKDLAQDAHTAPHHFIKKFSRSSGLSPHQFQLQNQIRKAKRLLQAQLPVAEVAQRCGFYDQSHFIRHFKKRTGLTPSDYQKACHKLH